MTPRLRIRSHGGMFTAAQIAALAELAEQAGSIVRIGAGGGFEFDRAPDGTALAGLAHTGLRSRTGGGFTPGVLGPAMSGRGGPDLRELTAGLERDLSAVTIPRREHLVLIEDAQAPTGVAAHIRVVADGDRLRIHSGEDPVTTVLPSDPAGSRFALPRVIARLLRADPAPAAETEATAPAPVGWLPHGDTAEVSLGAALDDGLLEPRRLAFLAAIERPVTVTAWRTLIVHDMDEGTAEQVVRVLAPMGFVFDAASPAVPSPNGL